jgi:hypothetical protein
MPRTVVPAAAQAHAKMLPLLGGVFACAVRLQAATSSILPDKAYKMDSITLTPGIAGLLYVVILGMESHREAARCSTPLRLLQII